MLDGWLEQRAAEFAEFQADHPNLEARVAGAIAETAARVAEYAEQRRAQAEADRARLLAHSRSLTGDQSDRILTLEERALDLWRSGDYDAAEPLFREVLEIDPIHGNANYHLGDCLRQRGDLQGAAASFSVAASFPDLSDGANTGYFRSMLAMQDLPAPPDPRIAEPPVIFRVADLPELWDAPEAPRMLIIPAGEYTMGAPAIERNHQESETPHRVTIDYPLGVSKYDVTRGEFAAFVAETGYDARGADGCFTYTREKGFERDPGADWRSPGFTQSDDEPVVCINYHDGVAYAAWLSQKTGHNYRLPSEAEWEYAVRAGTATSYYWGEELGMGHAHCDGCNPGSSILKPLPGGTFPPNPFGLYDVSGNVWKWLADCWNNNYIGAPTDGSAWETGNCRLRGRRGGSWFNVSEARPGDFRAPFRLRSAARFGSLPDLRFSSFGLRVVRSISPPSRRPPD